MKILLQKLFAKIIQSGFVLQNPYINYELIENKLNILNIQRCSANVTQNNLAQFYSEAVVHNLQNNPAKIIINENSHIRGELLIFAHAGSITIGENCYVGKNTAIWSANEVKIGNNVLISHNCNIIDTNSHELNHLERAESYQKMLRNGHRKTPPNVLSAPIFIDDFAWLSFNVTVLKGVKIGKGAIVGANSVVTKDVEDFTLVAGNPAKFVKKTQKI